MNTSNIQEGKQLMQAMQFTKAEEKFQAELKSGSSPVEAHLWLARLSFMRKQDENGLAHLSEALTIQPQNAEAFALRAILSMRQRKYAEAVEYLEKARKLQPELNMIYYNLAKSYRKLEQYERAEEIARTGLKQDPTNFHLHAELAYILGRTERLEEGIGHLLEAIRINPLYLKGYLIVGQLYKMAGRGELVIQLYQQGLARNPDAHALRIDLCDLYALKNDFVSAYREAVFLAIRRNDYRDYLRLGTYAIVIGQVEKAEKAFRKSLEIKPSSWEGHLNLGELYYAAKLMKEAKEQYRLAIEKNNRSPKPHNAMGLFALHQDKDLQTAGKHFEKASELAPEEPESYLNLALLFSMQRNFETGEQMAVKAARLSRPGDPNRSEAERLAKAIQREK